MIWTQLHAQLDQTLKKRQILPTNQKILVAVSGGQDSLCLIKILLDLQKKWHWQIAIAHCDHRWREDSSHNADYVETLAEKWQIPFFRVTATAMANSEATARTWRYQALQTTATHHHYDYIVTGHTATDRAETLLFNLIRGTATNGLQALTWQRAITPDSNILLVRPLLEITRQDTGNFCQEQGIKIWRDQTNQDVQYSRNKIRLEVFPLLAQINPQVTQNLAQTAEILQAEVDLLSEITRQWQAKVLVVPPIPPEKTDCQYLDRVILRQIPLAIQRRLIHTVLQNILPSTPNFHHVEKIIYLITAPNQSQTDPLPGGAIARVKHPWIEIILP